MMIAYCFGHLESADGGDRVSQQLRLECRDKSMKDQRNEEKDDFNLKKNKLPDNYFSFAVF